MIKKIEIKINYKNVKTQEKYQSKATYNDVKYAKEDLKAMGFRTSNEVYFWKGNIIAELSKINN